MPSNLQLLQQTASRLRYSSFGKAALRTRGTASVFLQQGQARSSSTASTLSSWSQTLSFASPESDFSMPSSREFSAQAVSTSQVMPSWSQTLSFASPESDFCMEQSDASGLDALPMSLADALLLNDEAVVVTTATAPHKIVHVNEAWEDLCGHSKQEALHETLAMLQGPDTSVPLVQDMVQRVLQTHVPQEAYVVNYRKNGTPFTNHVRAGYVEESNGVSYLVGLLRPVSKAPTLSLATARILA